MGKTPNQKQTLRAIKDVNAELHLRPAVLKVKHGSEHAGVCVPQVWRAGKVICF